MTNTHFITISKEQFDEIEVGDRLILQNDKDRFCYVVYVDDDNNSSKFKFSKADIDEMNELIRKSRNQM